MSMIDFGDYTIQKHKSGDSMNRKFSAKPKVLVIEDEGDIQLIIQSCLGEMVDMVSAVSLKQAEILLESTRFDLILLDVILPDGNGFDFAHKLKNSGQNRGVPLIFLTGQSSPDNKVLGLQLGANDYITKPFHIPELLARVEVQLRQAKSSASLIFYHADEGCSVRLDVNSMQTVLFLKQKEVLINLTPVEFKLLKLLIDSQGQVLTRKQLIDSAWSKSITILDRTIDRHISTLRKKIGPVADNLTSVSGQGYKLAPSHERQKAAGL